MEEREDFQEQNRIAGEETDRSTETEGLEENLAKLREIISRLESGKLDLSESLREFENGVALVRRSKEQLDSAEKRLQVLTEEGTVHDL